eukprot:1404485-Amphidinium_carterae.1
MRPMLLLPEDVVRAGTILYEVVLSMFVAWKQLLALILQLVSGVSSCGLMSCLGYLRMSYQMLSDDACPL